MSGEAWGWIGLVAMIAFFVWEPWTIRWKAKREERWLRDTGRWQ